MNRSCTVTCLSRVTGVLANSAIAVPDGSTSPNQLSGRYKGIYMRVYLDDERNTPEGWVRVYWPDEAIALRGFRPPKIGVHSANSSARDKMLAGIRTIERLSASS